MCRISVIMPSLNVGHYIKKCMESVLAQSFKDIEIICVDAGSTDGTYEILQKFACKDNRIKVMHSDIKSYGYQLNLAIKNACGDYIGIVETDDFIDKDMYSNLYEVAIKYNVDYVKGNYKEFLEKNDKTIISDYKRIRLPQKYLDSKIDLEKETEARLIDINHIWSGIYSKKFLQDNNIKFNETPGASFQDTSFSILVGMLAKSCVYADIAMYYYRIDNADSSVKSDSKINCIIDEFRYVESQLNERNLFSDNDIKNLINKVKINSYKWNYSRLSIQSAKKFANNVKQELLAMKEMKYIDEVFDYNEQKYIDIILGLEEDIPDYSIDAFDNTIKLIDLFKQNKKIYLICAGDYANRIICLQEYMGSTSIAAVFDNAELKVGTIFNGYKIKSTSELKNTDGKYIIASRYACADIYDQIISKCEKSVEIIKCEELPQFENMINIYLKYANK